MAKLDWERATERERIRSQRESRPMGPKVEWWWTLTGRASKCHGCGNPVAKDEQVAWNHEEGRMVCRSCVEHLDIQPAVSKRLRKRMAKTGELFS